MATQLSLPGFAKRRISQRTEDVLTAYLCLLPWIIGFLVFTLGPLVFSFVLSFFRADLFTRNVFIGLENYQELVRDPLFLKSLRITAVYAFVSVPLGAATALAVALLLNQKVVGLGVWRTVYYLPSVISGVAVAVLWMQISTQEWG